MNKQCYKCGQPLEQQNYYGLHEACFLDWFELDTLSEFSNIIRQSTDTSSADPMRAPLEIWNSSFFQGQFKKYSGQLGAFDYILKVQETEAPELPMVEYVCNQIASALTLPIPPYYLIAFYGTPCFVSRNFTTNYATPSTLNHIYHYVTDAAHYTCANLLAVIEEKTGHYSDQEQFVRMCLYDALIGNHDRHGRNLGFLIDRNKTKLAPIYDNTSALGLEQGQLLKAQFNPCGKIATAHTQTPTLKDYVQDFLNLGFSKTVHAFYKRIPADHFSTLIEKSFCSDLMKSAIQRLINVRVKEYEDALR